MALKIKRELQSYRIDLTNLKCEFVENLLNEFVPMFEGEYFHIGADEYIPIDEYSNYQLKLTQKRNTAARQRQQTLLWIYKLCKRDSKEAWKNNAHSNDGLGPHGTMLIQT